MRKRNSVALVVIGLVMIVLVAAAAIPPPPPPPPGGGNALGPVGVPSASSNASLQIESASSWIEWQTGWGGERPFIRSSNSNAREAVLRSGALGKMVVIGERKGTTFFVHDYFPSSLLAPWQKEILPAQNMLVEFLPGVKISVLTATGWQAGSLEDIVDSFSIIEGIPTAQGIYPLRVSIP